MVQSEKHILRERILTLLRSQKEEERLNKSLKIADKLYMMREFNEAKTVLFYASFDGEVNTFEMIKQAQQLKKQVALPCVEKSSHTMTPRVVCDLNDLKTGSYGIKEPNEEDKQLDLKDIDLVVVPGIAFDKNNNRLGRGGGYYDRMLSFVNSNTCTVGLAFDFQVVDNLPSIEAHDKQMTCVLSS